MGIRSCSLYLISILWLSTLAMYARADEGESQFSVAPSTNLAALSPKEIDAAAKGWSSAFLRIWRTQILAPCMARRL